MFENMDGRLVLVLGVVALLGNLFCLPRDWATVACCGYCWARRSAPAPRI